MNILQTANSWLLPRVDIINLVPAVLIVIFGFGVHLVKPKPLSQHGPNFGSYANLFWIVHSIIIVAIYGARLFDPPLAILLALIDMASLSLIACALALLGGATYNPHMNVPLAVFAMTIGAMNGVSRPLRPGFCDLETAMAGAAAALYGPLHGGANEAVLRMLNEIGDVQHIPAFIKRVKAGEGRLMGFGHRVYKSYDPRAKIIKQTADEVFDVTGRNPLLDIALELERIALQDDYFITRKLYPNVDFYSGLMYQAMGFPVTMFPVLFAIPRTAGWIAQWEEMLLDPEQKIARPRQLYVGSGRRDYVPPAQRR